MNESARQIDQGPKQIFGSFLLEGSEFALAVSYVQEVVNAPTAYTAVPLAPAYLKGLFNLRGTVIPVIDLRTLLQLDSTGYSDNQKIAVIELEGTLVGLLFDKTGEIFRSSDEERSDFDTNHSSNVISGVFKREAGRRIVQILDVKNIFKLQNVPKDASRNRLERDSLGRKRGNRKQCISFVVGPAKCALAISDIQEILKVNKLGGSVLSAGHCIGSIDLRGTTVPVIDFASLLNYRPANHSEKLIQGDRRIIVMRLEKELFGLLVDSVESIVSYFPDELLTFPLVEQARGDMFVGCIQTPGNHDILLLDHLKILSDSEIFEITRGHSKIYQNSTSDKKAPTAGTRRTYLTFSINSTYAVPIGDVKEIIEYPKSMLQPPGLKQHVQGVLNLRGALVSIIDPRSLYSTESHKGPENDGTKKVLVFNKHGILFGLIVDSVDSIVNFNENEKMKLPQILLQQTEQPLSSDVSEAVQVTDVNGIKRSFLILNADSIASRVSNTLVASI